MRPVPDDDPAVLRAGRAVDGERLPCGASLDRLVDQVTEGGLPQDAEHQRRCPHCRAALAELRDSWASVQDLAADEVHAPAALLSAVMARVREVSRNPWYAVFPGAQGGTRIAARVVGMVVGLAAESVPNVGLAVGRGRSVEPSAAGHDGEPGTRVGVAGHFVAVDVKVVVDYGAPIAEVARQLRDRIRRELRRHTGLHTTEVNIEVVDVHRQDADPGHG
jgi:uncharacterized alkaline shock family protein YloU